MADRHGPALEGERGVRVAVEREAVVPAAEETEAVEQAVEAKVVVAWAAGVLLVQVHHRIFIRA